MVTLTKDTDANNADDVEDADDVARNNECDEAVEELWDNGRTVLLLLLVQDAYIQVNACDRLIVFNIEEKTAISETDVLFEYISIHVYRDGGLDKKTCLIIVGVQHTLGCKFRASRL